MRELLRSAAHETHGLWMWSAWFIGGLLLLVTKRYLKKYWRFSHWLHALLGYFVLVVTLFFAMSVTRWDPFFTIHTAVGSLAVLVTLFGALTGSLAAGLM